MANENKPSDFSDLGFVEQSSTQGQDDFSDLGFQPAEQGQNLTPTPSTDFRESGLNQAIAHGIHQSITGEGLRNLAKADPNVRRLANDLTGGASEFFFKPAPKAPETSGETAASFLTGFTDPVGVAIGGVVSGLAQPIIQGTRQGVQGARAAKILSQRPSTIATRSLIKNQAATMALDGAAQMSAIGATQEGTRQVAEGKFDPLALAEKTAASAALGAGGGVLLGAGAAKIKGIQAARQARIAGKGPETFQVQNTPAKDALAKRLEEVKAAEAATFTKEDELFTKNKARQLIYTDKIATLEKAQEELAQAAKLREASLTGQYVKQADSINNRLQIKQQRLANLRTPTDPAQINDRISSLEANRLDLQKQLDNLSGTPEAEFQRFKIQEQMEGILEQQNDIYASVQSPPEVARTRQLALENEIQGLQQQAGEVQDVLKRFEVYQKYNAPEAFQGQDLSLRAQSAGTKLNELRDSFNRRSESLVAQQERWINKFKDADLQKAESTVATQAKLKDLYDEIGAIEAIQRKMDFVGTQANVKIGAKNSALNRATRNAINVASEQMEKVKEMKRLGTFTDEQLNSLAQAEFDNALRLQGVTADEYVPKSLGFFQTQSRKWSAVEGATGTNTGQTVLNTITARNKTINDVAQKRMQIQGLMKELNDLGYNNEQITMHMPYYEAGVGFVKEPRAKVRGPWPTSLEPGPQAKDAFMRLREASDELHQIGVQSGYLKADQYIPGYVPLREKTLPKGSAGISKYTDPTFAQARTDGMLDPLLHEMDYAQLMDRYAREVYAAANLSPQLKSGVKELVKLRALKQFRAADDFEAFLKDTFNIENKQSLEQMYGETLFRESRQDIERMLAEKNVPQDAIGEVANAFNEVGYKSLVALNPKSNLAQWLQTDFQLPAEVGLKAHVKARLGAANPAERARIGQLLKYSIIDEIPALEELPLNKPTTATARFVKAVGNAVTEPIPVPFTNKKLPGLGSLFKAGEKNNRITAMLAADYKIRADFQNQGAEGIEKTIKNLLPAEQNYVRAAYERGGIDAAAAAYSLQVDRRVNFSYSGVDKPDALRQGIGRYIPFTTFARNVMENYASDLANGKYEQFAKRIATVYAAKSFYESLTGLDFAPVDPNQGMGNMLKDVSVAPAVTAPAAAALQFAQNPSQAGLEKAGKAAMNATPVGSAVRVYNNLERTGNPFGLKKASKDTWLKKLFE